MVAPLIAALGRAAGAAAKGAAKGAAKAKTKKPRARKPSDDRYNERRRARRAAERLEKQAKFQSGSALKETRKEISTLKKAIRDSLWDKQSKSYKNALGQLDLRTRVAREISNTIKELQQDSTFKENARINKMVESYFRSASLTKEQRESGIDYTPAQKLARAEQAFVYQKTRELWLDGSEAMRNANIIAGMQGIRLSNGRMVQNMQDVMSWLKEVYPDEYPTMERVTRGEFDTETDESFQNEREKQAGSPPQISRSQWRQFGAKL